MRISLTIVLFALSVCYGQAPLEDRKSKAIDAINHLSKQSFFSHWADDGWTKNHQGYSLLLTAGGYGIRNYTGRKNAAGKQIYQYEAGSFERLGNAIRCKSGGVFTSTTAEQTIVQGFSSTSINFTPLEDVVEQPKEMGKVRTLHIIWIAGEPEITIDRAKLHLIEP